PDRLPPVAIAADFDAIPAGKIPLIGLVDLDHSRYRITSAKIQHDPASSVVHRVGGRTRRVGGISHTRRIRYSLRCYVAYLPANQLIVFVTIYCVSVAICSQLGYRPKVNSISIAKRGQANEARHYRRELGYAPLGLTPATPHFAKPALISLPAYINSVFR